MRRGQIIGQVFVFIIAAVIFILILTYGYKAFNTLRTRGDEVAFVDFVSKLKNEVKSISLSYGSTKKLELSGLPAKYKTICFVTENDIKENLLGTKASTDPRNLNAKYPMIYSLYEPNGEANVFFMPGSPTPVKVDNIQACDDPNGQACNAQWFCSSLDRGSVTLRLEGLGNGVRVSEWPTTP